MTKPKKRNKKYNKYKNAEICTDYALKNVFVAFVTGQDDSCLVINRKGELLHTSYKLYRAIAEVKHKWSVYMSVFGFEPCGDPYNKSSELSTKVRYYQRDLVDVLNKEHQKLVKNFNQEQKHGAGWIASPVGVRLEEKEAFNIFEKLGAWS
jgi:hypothetical protein